MKQFIKLAVAAAAIAFSASASATLITTSYTPTTSVTINKNQPLNWTFDFGSKGYVVGTDSIDSANLVITLTDSNGPESFTFSVNNTLIASGTDVPDGTSTNYGPYSITGTSLTDLSNTGKLSLNISTTSGTFMFITSSLTGNRIVGEANSASVPEPMSLALLGFGLLGIASVRRKA